MRRAFAELRASRLCIVQVLEQYLLCYQVRGAWGRGCSACAHVEQHVLALNKIPGDRTLKGNLDLIP